MLWLRSILIWENLEQDINDVGVRVMTFEKKFWQLLDLAVVIFIFIILSTAIDQSIRKNPHEIVFGMFKGTEVATFMDWFFVFCTVGRMHIKFGLLSVLNFRIKSWK